MKSRKSYLKLCNNPYKEKAEKFEKRVIITTIIVSIFTAILAFVIVFFR